MANRETRRSNGREGRPNLVRTHFTDEQGFKWIVMIPPDESDHPERGIIVGPPSFDDVGLPPDLQRILHNQLFDRGIITKADLKNRNRDVFAALQATYRVDFTKVTEAYF